MQSVSARQGLLEGSGEAEASPREEALVNEVAALRSDVSAALKDLSESDGMARPELAPLLSSISTSLEALRSQVRTIGTCYFLCMSCITEYARGQQVLNTLHVMLPGGGSSFRKGTVC